VAPHDVDALAEAMGRMLGDAALRDAMVRRGLLQARQFTWSSAAEKLLQIYRATT
jgi:alpha-1,3-rhamnosyl/mannosyltransferase